MFMIEPYYFEYDFVLQMSLYFLDRKVSRGITFILAIIWQAKNDSSASSTLGIPTNFLPDKSGFCTEWFCSRSADWAPFPCCASMTSTGSIQPWKTEYIFGCLASLKTSSSLSLPLTPSLTSSLLQWSVAALLMNIWQPFQLYVTLWLWFFSFPPPPLLQIPSLHRKALVRSKLLSESWLWDEQKFCLCKKFTEFRAW